MDFVLGCIPPASETPPSYEFLFQQNNLLVRRTENGYTVPVSEDPAYMENNTGNRLYIGSIDGRSCYTARFREGGILPQGYELLGLRQLYGQIDQGMMKAAFRAVQIITWDETHRFCSVCGEATFRKTDEHAKVCPKCGQFFYPRLAPAVIVAVTKGDKLLLARNRNFVSGMFSVPAGFVEAGETLEECVKREIKEEVGISVKNIRYFTSQPWPFPNSLMLAFTAEYESGTIRVDGDEIVEAGWFSVEEIPMIPGKLSVARKLIEWFMEKHRK